MPGEVEEREEGVKEEEGREEEAGEGCCKCRMNSRRFHRMMM